MISALVIVFREMLEMALVVSVLMAATRGLPDSRRWISAGALLGLTGAAFFGLFMAELESAFDGEGEYLFNAVVLLLASMLIAWTVFWMGMHGREISGRLSKAGAAVRDGALPYSALLMVVLFAVMREGSEAVFFLFGAAQGMDDAGHGMLLGGLLGAGSALLAGGLLYFGLVRIPLQTLFTVSGWLLMLLAAGMASQASWNLVVIEWLPPVVERLWDSSSLLSQDSLAGQILHVLVGYDDQPSALQVIVFVAALTIMASLHSYLHRHPSVHRPATS